MRRLTLIALLLAGAALTGCAAGNPNASAGDFKGTERDVAQVIDDLKGSRDPEEICSRMLTDAFAKSLASGGRDCVDEVKAALRDVADTGMKVKDVTVTGSTARAAVSQDELSSTFELERSGTSWQIDSFGDVAAR